MKSIQEQLDAVQSHAATNEDRSRAWQAIESRIALLPVQTKSKKPLFFTPMPFVPIMLAILLVISGSAATAVAADSSIPGDALYPIDRAVESIRLNLTISQEAKAKLQIKFAEERFDETAKVIAREQAHLRIEGTGSSTSTPTVKGSARAQTALDNAITTLTDVQVNLSAKGNANAAAQIGTVIERLQGLNVQATSTFDIDADATVDTDDEIDDNRKVNSNVNANTNANANVNVNINGNTLINIGNAILTLIEADVNEDNATEVKIKYLGGEAETTVSGKNRAEIVSQLADMLHRSSIEIDAVLKVEVAD